VDDNTHKCVQLIEDTHAVNSQENYSKKLVVRVEIDKEVNLLQMEQFNKINLYKVLKTFQMLSENAIDNLQI